MTDIDEKRWPLIIRREDAIGMKQAEDLTQLSARTLKRIVQEHAIGTQTSKNAPWRISAPGLLMAINKDVEALKALREGDRDGWLVQRYLTEVEAQITRQNTSRANGLQKRSAQTTYLA